MAKQRSAEKQWCATEKKKQKVVKPDGFPVFWPALFTEYWQRLPWHLPINQEPEPATGEGEECPPDTADDTLNALGLNLTKEELDPKGKIPTELKAASTAKSPAMRQRIHANDLARLHREENKSPLKRSSDFQFHMCHPDYKEAGAERFEEKLGDEPKAKHIALQCLVMQEMLAANSDDIKSCIKLECDAEHERELEAYKDDSEEGMLSPDTDVQRACCENFLTIIQSFLARLHAYTGLMLNIIMSRINSETKQFETVSLGKLCVGVEPL
ncbi:hypothetical protein K438DRAFT_1968472 [Mycena galopus ATCC 62051]|nr:hypothetical protein K438DRAFT_1968472 [Mycena galopus ATCC 62051]